MQTIAKSKQKQESQKLTKKQKQQSIWVNGSLMVEDLIKLSTH